MIQTYFQKLDHYIQEVPRVFRQLSEEKRLKRPAPDKWSRQELLGHLIDSALYNWQRFTSFQDEPEPYVIRSYKQDALVRTNDYQAQNPAHLLSLWQGLNQQILDVIRTFTPEELKHKVVIDYNEVSGDMTWWISDYVDHLEHHLKQIFGSLDVLKSKENWHLQLGTASKALADQASPRFIELLRHGSLSVELYQPEKVDLQQPHTRDELYVVASGSGEFLHEGKRMSFEKGDVLFVPAGDEHRFENFTDDFQAWVVFYGPEGGEAGEAFFEWTKEIAGETFVISTDDRLLQIDAIYDYLRNAYWAKGRSKETVAESLRHSINLGLYREGEQIGLARVVTDRATRATLCDVYVLDDFRSKGLGKWLTEMALQHPDLQTVKKWQLKTDDAHTLYARFGFEITKEREKIMELRKSE